MESNLEMTRQAADSGIEVAGGAACRRATANWCDPIGTASPGAGAGTGGMGRRRFIAAGGLAVATTAVITACKGAMPLASPVPSTTSTTMLAGTPKDIAILNTAISLEAMAVAVYTTVLAGTLVQSSSNQDLLKLFQNQHSQHQDLLTRTTRGAGGNPVTKPNATIMAQVVQPRMATLASESDVVNLAYLIEHLLAATCQADVGAFSHPTFDTTIAQIGGIEARHVGLMAVATAKSATGTPDGAFQVDTDAVSPGVGV